MSESPEKTVADYKIALKQALEGKSKVIPGENEEDRKKRLEWLDREIVDLQLKAGEAMVELDVDPADENLVTSALLVVEKLMGKVEGGAPLEEADEEVVFNNKRLLFGVQQDRGNKVPPEGLRVALARLTALQDKSDSLKKNLEKRI